MKKARSYRSKILEDFIREVESRPDHNERLRGTHLMLLWNIDLGTETACMMSGAMEGEYDEIQNEYKEIFYNEIECWRNIKICTSKNQNSTD